MSSLDSRGRCTTFLSLRHSQTLSQNLAQHRIPYFFTSFTSHQLASYKESLLHKIRSCPRLQCRSCQVFPKPYQYIIATCLLCTVTYTKQQMTRRYQRCRCTVAPLPLTPQAGFASRMWQDKYPPLHQLHLVNTKAVGMIMAAHVFSPRSTYGLVGPYFHYPC